MEAQRAFETDEVPIGAVIVCQKKIIARAHNQVELLNDPTAHAEILCLTAAANKVGSKYLPDYTLYITLEPCPMCAAATAWAQLDRICFAANDPKRGYSCFQPSLLHKKTMVSQGILAQESTELLRSFFAKKR